MARSTDSTYEIIKKLAYTQDLISCAFHESGHTIFGLLRLAKVESVKVFHDKDNRFSGLAHYDLPDLDKFSDLNIRSFLINSEISLLYAGLAAEKYHFKTTSGSDKFPLFLREWSSDDTLSASKLIIKYNIIGPGRKRYVYKKKLIQDTLNELVVYWESVTLVAHDLFKKKRLSYLDLKKLLTTKSEYKDFWKNQFRTINHIYKIYDRLDDKKFNIILTRLNLI